MTWLFIIGIFLAAAAALTALYPRSEGVRRRRLQLLGAGVALSLSVAAMSITGWILFEIPHPLSTAIGLSLLSLPLTAVLGSSKLALGVADRAFHTALRVAAVATFAAAVLVIVVAGLGGRPERVERGTLGLALLGFAAVLLAGIPLWKRSAAIAHALTYGDRPAPSEIPKDLAARLTRPAPPEEILLQFAEVLHAGLRLRSVEIWTVDGASLERAVSLPHLPSKRTDVDPASLPVLTRVGVTGRAWLEVWMAELAGEADRNVRVVPATYGGNVLAIVMVERQRRGDIFTPSDDELMIDVARRLGAALQSQRLDQELRLTMDELRRHADDLKASRARIVAVADDERRRLERDLHDGAQQRLVALSVQLALAREILKDDPAQADAFLDELTRQAHEAIAELRTLAHGIYPPILELDGLGGALRDVAARAAIATDVELIHVDRYARDVESAIYFCCLEALQNAAKHAGSGARARIRLEQTRAKLVFEVVDDGVGFDGTDAPRGRGFVNMSDRLGAIGGRLEVESSAGAGTQVRGEVPLSAARAVRA